MGILNEDVVMRRQPNKEGEPSVITVNCPDITGLGCDLCRMSIFRGSCDTYNSLRAVLGDSLLSCEIEKVGSEVTTCSRPATLLPLGVTEDMFKLEMHDQQQRRSVTKDSIVTVLDININSQIADSFTKTLPVKMFKKHAEGI